MRFHAIFPIMGERKFFPFIPFGGQVVHQIESAQPGPLMAERFISDQQHGVEFLIIVNAGMHAMKTGVHTVLFLKKDPEQLD